MKVDKEKLDKLLAMNDEELWEQIRRIAQDHGISLPSRAPEPSEMQKLRGAVSHGARVNLARAIKIINDHKKGQENGR